MTFKTPSLTVYFGSLLIALPIAGLAYWILQTQNLVSNSLLVLGAGLLIGHLVGACSRASSPQQQRERATTAHHFPQTTAIPESGDTISLYVGNLAYRAKRDELHTLFSQYGEVNSVRIMMDRTTHRPRGYAFVEMESNAAHKAITQLDNTEFCERNLRVSEAKQRQ
ncbi:MAG: RNA-binding protein [Gammaproteobacteria bacterium]|nr:RNA-binding protein [Gammaproteobacteria bacterium]